jgi:sarcosine oxidase subunit alpha
VALALVEDGAARHGESLLFEHLGETRRGTLAPTCALDPGGDRLHA